ncbi:putative toxin-antitoxin system toxin component, PIN family [Candidatus Woesearchaeota archaeon]|nr:putative toxin-antitoxin system toxin component, PIN family [Candidatus Woesearchaeota archaeon]
MRVTLDTNVLVSGTFWIGNSFRIMVLADTDKLISITSQELINEYYKTINSDEIIDKMSEKSLKVMKIVDRVIKKSEIVEPFTRLNIIKDDPDDNKVLECAIAGKVDCIVSKDNHFLKLKTFSGIPIMTSDEFAIKYFKSPQ